MKLRLLSLVCIIFSVASGFALEVADVFSDHMVLQRNRPIYVWGWGEPDTEVFGTLGGESLSTNTDANGKWRLCFSSLPASKDPISLSLRSGDESLSISDILVGEVWLCSGQSNMEWDVLRTKRGAETLNQLNEPWIRLFHVPHRISYEPQERVDARWTLANEATVSRSSAVGFYYGQILEEALDVPVGLIMSAFGGTPAQSWTEMSYLEREPKLAHYASEFEEQKDAPKEYNERLLQWEAAKEALLKDRVGITSGWHLDGVNAEEWLTCSLPQVFSKHLKNDMDGAVWYRKEFELDPAHMDGSFELSLGPIDDFDETYINGHLVGSIGPEVEGYWEAPRVYTVKPEWLRPGKNVIAVRVLDVYLDGGFTGRPDQMKLSSSETGQCVALSGVWMYRVEQSIATPRLEDRQQHVPSVLYNGMIHPMVGFPIRGTIWYQGENNASKPVEYETLFPAMIQSWRNAWGQGDFPFYFVQLANFKPVQVLPAEGGWANLREAQFKTLELPKTGMAVALDIGEADDIHPRNKYDVASRLAAHALHNDYGLKEAYPIYSGPLYESMEIRKDKVYLSFKHVGQGLVAKGERLTGFAIAGKDGVFVWADAVIEGNRIVVSSDTVKCPVAVRYAWASNPIGNLYNKAGFPASSFRTDSF